MSKLRELLIGEELLSESKSIDLWMTRDEDDTLVLSTVKPQRDRDFGWVNKKDTYIYLPDKLYPEVTSKDEQPRKVRLTLV